MIKISVVIPCYNLGKYIDEAVQSVLDQTYQNFEIIIVDDGSTDIYTTEKLQNYNKPKTKVIITENAGVSAARNTAISLAKGEYILPLDADDKIGKEYLELAVNILDKNNDIGIVYCLANYIGGRTGRYRLAEYSLNEMLHNNVIFCSGLFRRADWQQIGGYNTNMTIGLEDWDFWLSILELKREVSRIDKTLFYYRVIANSRSRQMSLTEEIKMHTQVYRNHLDFYSHNIEVIFKELYEIKRSKAYRLTKNMMSPKKLFIRLLCGLFNR